MYLIKIFVLLTVIVVGSQFLFANYAFYRKVSNTCKYYRVTVDEKKIVILERYRNYLGEILSRLRNIESKKNSSQG